MSRQLVATAAGRSTSVPESMRAHWTADVNRITLSTYRLGKGRVRHSSNVISRDSER
jgi:hypothetical protein